jgi:hypothetical protein
MLGNDPKPLSLLSTCLETLACHPDVISTLVGVPEELVLELFEQIIQRGKLTPRLLEVFTRTEHELLIDLVTHMKISRYVCFKKKTESYREQF